MFPPLFTESLINFPRRSSGLLPRPQQQVQQPEGQHQTSAQNLNSNDQSSAQASIMQLASCTNGVGSGNNSVDGLSSASQSATTITGLQQHQNPMNFRQESQLGS